MQEGSGILGILGIKTNLGKIPILGSILLWRFKMNELVNNFLLAVDKSIPEIYSTLPRFNYDTCVYFTKIKEGIQKFKEKVDSKYLYISFNMIWSLEILKIYH